MELDYKYTSCAGPDLKNTNQENLEISEGFGFEEFQDAKLLVKYNYDSERDYGDWCSSQNTFTSASTCPVRVEYSGKMTQRTRKMYEYIGDLTAKIYFNDKLLDFSDCQE